ncbi:MAG TPA: chemotaxis protein CheB [Gemmatimonadaceae bacterium]
MAATKRSKAPKPTTDPFPVVGIGASAGGLRALQNYFSKLPSDTGMSFVVIVHLDPAYKSQMARLIQNHTEMPVSQPETSVKIKPNHVYIIPPDKDLSLDDGQIRTSPRAAPQRNRAPIDLFFRTLAETHHSKALAIVMSGTGSDGSRGISFVRELGGITMAQTPEDAEFPELPNSAISTGYVDIVLPIEKLAAETVRLSRASPIRHNGDVEPLPEADDDVTIGRILAYLRVKTGHDFSGYRRATVMRRLERRIHFTQSENLAGYLRNLTSMPDEAHALLNDLLITVTSFFRDPEAFDALRREVLPRLFSEAGSDGLRVWVAGCATGEEAYSLAILLCEYSEGFAEPPPIQIFATDVHERSFAYARDGFYPDTVAADVSPSRLERFFSREPGGYRVKKVIREKVLFASHDLLKDPPFSRLDLISCRNLLIYLGTDAKHRVASVFHFALRPGGYLLLGSSEGMDQTSTLFAPVDRKQRIFRALMTDHRTHVFTSPDDFRPLPPLAGPPRRRSAPTPTAWTLHQQVLEAYASPSLLVNEEGIVIHLSARVGAYLQRRGGEPTHKLLDMLPRNMRPRFRTMLTRAFKDGKPGHATNFTFDIDGKRQHVDVMVKPIESDRRGNKVALVVFEQHTRHHKSRLSTTVTGRSGASPAPRVRGRKGDSDIDELKRELQATIDEHESMIEEARATNEELQSINEEQRATAEELETSKEELQSLNEELRTVNQEYRNQNEQLAQTNADLENLIDSTDIGTIFLDRDLCVRRFTLPVTNVFNFVATDVGRLVSDVTNRLRYSELMDDLSQVLQRLTRLEREVIADNGRWFMVRISPYKSTDNRIEGVVLALFDITERKLAEIERELLLHDTQSASTAKSNFMGVMSHELRTPLNAIVGYAGIMNAGAIGSISSEQSRQLDRISASAMHLSHLLDDALEAARLDSGSPAIHFDRIDLSFLIREVTEAVAPLAAKRGLAFNVDVPAGMAVTADATKIRQILFNLLSNAVRFTDKGQIDLSARIQDDRRLTMSVKDTGIGIAPEHLDKIFDRFWQVDQSRTRTRGGTGLGLLVSRALARQLGGDLVVTSELGHGSTFTVTIPVKVAKAVAEEQISEPQSQTAPDPA